jgi:hypothetical protein
MIARSKQRMMVPVTKKPGDNQGYINSERSQNSKQQILTKSFILGNLNKGRTQYYKNPYSLKAPNEYSRFSLVKQPEQASTERRQSNNQDSIDNQIQHSRLIQLQENTLTQSMNVIFNKNERIISGKASHLKVANNMTTLSRNLQRS